VTKTIEHAELVRRFSADMAAGVRALAQLGYPAGIFQQLLANPGAAG
jgi:hypothetical protein